MLEVLALASLLLLLMGLVWLILLLCGVVGVVVRIVVVVVVVVGVVVVVVVGVGVGVDGVVIGVFVNVVGGCCWMLRLCSCRVMMVLLVLLSEVLPHVGVVVVDVVDMRLVAAVAVVVNDFA